MHCAVITILYRKIGSLFRGFLLLKHNMRVMKASFDMDQNIIMIIGLVLKTDQVTGQIG